MSRSNVMARTRGRIIVGLAAAGIAAAFSFVDPGFAANDIMTTAVGTGEKHYPSGDNMPATDAGLDGPRMIAFDRKGGYYIADTYHHVIRHVDANGIITTFAGTGHPGFGGDGGPALQAQFNAPHSVDVDAAGNVIIGDPVNDRIRRVDAETGIVTTIAGIGTPGYSGDGAPATEAKLNDSKVAIVGPDGGIYIADYGNSVIRRIDPRNGIISTFAGNGLKGGTGDGGPAREASFAPRNITFDIDGDLLIADRETNKIRSIDADTGIITTIAGNGTEGAAGDGGPALEASLNLPRGLGVDWLGNVYIADSVNNKVRRVGTDGIITTIAGTGESGRKGDGLPATEAELTNPRHAIFDDAGNLYITDTGSNRIRRIDNFVPPRPAPAPTTTTTTAPPLANDGGNPGSTPPPQTQDGTVRGAGYWMLGADGVVYSFGDARRYGDAPSSAGAVDLEPTPSGNGYWVVDRAGRVTASGDARHLGNVAAGVMAPGEQATSLSATPSGQGYWVFTTRGRVVTFGDAGAYGDMSQVALNAPVLDSVPTPSGRGYYMVAADGGIFTFGDAGFHGSMGDTPLNAPVQSLVPDPDGAGYWLVASDGGVFAFDAPFRGSMGATKLNKPVTGMVTFGNGYLMVGEDGGIFNFSDKPFLGSLGDRPPANPIVSVAALA